MTDLETMTIFAAILLVGFVAILALHLRLLLALWWDYRRMMREGDLIKERLEYWVSGTGREEETA